MRMPRVVTTFRWSQNHQNPICEINPMEGPRQVPAGVFSRSVSRRLFTHLECANFRRSELCGDGTQPGAHNRYALADAYRPQVRTRGSQHHCDCTRTKPSSPTRLLSTHCRQPHLSTVIPQKTGDFTSYANSFLARIRVHARKVRLEDLAKRTRWTRNIYIYQPDRSS